MLDKTNESRSSLMVSWKSSCVAVAIATVLLAGCSEVEGGDSPEVTSDVLGTEDTLSLGLESACRSVDTLVELTPQYFPGATKPDETAEEINSRRSPFDAEVASLSAVLATIPRDSGFEDLLASLDDSAEATLQVAELVAARSGQFDEANLASVFDVGAWGEPLEVWHSAAQSSSQVCVDNGFLEETREEISEGSQFFDLLPFGSWDYQASEDDFGVIRHNWTSAATTNEPFAIGNLSLFIICWGDNVIINPSPRPYSLDAFGAYATGRNTQGVEIAFGGGQGIWQSSVVDGTLIGLYPADKESDFRSGNREVQSQISKETIEEFLPHETVSIGAEYSAGEISGRNYTRGLETVVDEMKRLGCW